MHLGRKAKSTTQAAPGARQVSDPRAAAASGVAAPGEARGGQAQPSSGWPTQVEPSTETHRKSSKRALQMAAHPFA